MRLIELGVGFMFGMITMFFLCRCWIYGTIQRQSTDALKKFVKMVERVIESRESEGGK